MASEGNDTPLQYSSLEKSHGWRSLVGYSPLGRKELDMTEQLHFTSLHLSFKGLYQKKLLIPLNKDSFVSHKS